LRELLGAFGVTSEEVVRLRKADEPFNQRSDRQRATPGPYHKLINAEIPTIVEN